MKTHGAAVMMKAEFQLCADIKLTFRLCSWTLSTELDIVGFIATGFLVQFYESKVLQK